MAVNVGKIGIELVTKINGAIVPLTNLQKQLRGTSTASKESNKALQTLAGTMSSFKNIILFRMGFGSLQQALNTVVRIIRVTNKEAVDFIENFNLFNVVMNRNFDSAINFQNRLTNAFRVNMSESMRYQGFFANLASSLKLTDDATEIFSENLVKLTYDLASLFNLDYATAYSKLGSGIIGQTKPLRSLGIDVTQQTLQPYLFEMGINKQVTELTQAEKVLLRYIAILDQSKNAQGDFARTIESPANQLKTLNEQLREVSRWVGFFSMTIMEKALPVINAFLISLNHVTKFLAMIFGFDLSKYDYMGKLPDDLLDLEDGLLNSLAASEALKGSLAGFDELNMVSQPSQAQSPMNLLGRTETYDTLMKFLTDYENGMEKVKMRADSIADSFMTWLGFVKTVNEETQEIVWNLGESGIKFMRWLGFVPTINLETGRTNWILKEQGGILADLVKYFRELWENGKELIKDVFQWFEDNPDMFRALTDIIKKGALIAAGFWLIKHPLALIVLAASFLINNYGKIKEWWKALTPYDGLITSLWLLAAGVTAVVVSLTGGIAGITIAKGLASALGTLGLAAIGFSVAGISSSIGSAYDNFMSNQGRSGTDYVPSVRPYANGGFPSAGQMFIAREAGPELVGNIGGRTAVANNDQIVAAVSKGVAHAVAGVLSNENGSQTVNIYLDDVLVGNSIINAINRATKNTGNTVLVG